jgi:glycosyltransferase involved in cell wall biosynthesis
MHVLQLGPYPPPHGGVQSNLVAIRDLVRKVGGRASVINLTRYRQADADDVFYPEGATGVLARMRALKPDIVHLHIGGDISNRLLVLGLACCTMYPGRAVLTLHSGGYPSSPEGQSARPRTFRGMVFRRFARVIAVNAALHELFLRFGVPGDRVRTIAPHALTSPADVDFPPALEDFLRAHDPVMISMGWLEPEYDYQLQIRALGAVLAKHPRAGLLILGAGRLEPELRAQIAATTYPGAILMPGDMPHAIALAAIARSSVFLRTTHYDGDSVSVREALHAGIPVVATDNRMRPPGVILMRAHNETSLCDAIEEALAQPRHAGSGGEDWSNIQAVVDLYRELLQKT